MLVSKYTITNSILDLIFLRIKSKEFNNHIISPDIWSLLDYAFLSIFITLEEEFIQEKKQWLIKNSDKEKKEFFNKVRCRLSSVETSNITSQEILKRITQEFTFIAEDFWNKYSKLVNITKRSKAW